MPSWKDELSDKERWQLVNYIRKLTKDAAAAIRPLQKTSEIITKKKKRALRCATGTAAAPSSFFTS